MLVHTQRLIVLRALFIVLVCQGSLGVHAAPGAEHDKAATPLSACILSTLNLRKADELGRLVAASGKYWVKSPSGGMSDPNLLKHLDLTNPEQREAFTAVNGAESLILEALASGADRCGIDEDEFEHAVGAVLTLEHDMGPADFLKGFTSREQEAVAASRTIRRTLLNSQEFQQSYQRALAEREEPRKGKGNENIAD